MFADARFERREMDYHGIEYTHVGTLPAGPWDREINWKQKRKIIKKKKNANRVTAILLQAASALSTPLHLLAGSRKKRKKTITERFVRK